MTHIRFSGEKVKLRIDSMVKTALRIILSIYCSTKKMTKWNESEKNEQKACKGQKNKNQISSGKFVAIFL